MKDQYQYRKPSLFDRDPEIKAEAVWAGPMLRRSNTFASRTNQVVQVLGQDGKKAIQIYDLPPYDSMMTHAADATSGRELLVLRERMRSWRFYDYFRTDRESPARISRVGTRTFALAGDGVDLAAALQTIIENDDQGLNAAIDDAFAGSSITVEETRGIFELYMHQHGLLRPLSVSELSDGTLRYRLLAAALMTPRPPPLVVLFSTATVSSRDSDFTGDDVEGSGTGPDRPCAHRVMRAFSPTRPHHRASAEGGDVPKCYRWTDGEHCLLIFKARRNGPISCWRRNSFSSPLIKIRLVSTDRP